jgi:cytochrome c5
MDLIRGRLYKSEFILITSIVFSACSDNEAPAEKGKVAVKQMETADTAAAPAMPAETPEAPVTAMPEQSIPVQQQQTAPPVLENNVIYQEKIYKNWPYTEAPQETAEFPVTGMIEDKVETAKAVVEEKMAAVEQEVEAIVAPVVTTVTETPVPETTAGKTTTAAAAVDGGQIYNTYCAICHKLGMNAAPKYGSKPLWAKRIAQGRDTVYSNSINGLRGMPPKGGFANLSDAEVKAGVDYMVRAAGGWGDK